MKLIAASTLLIGTLALSCKAPEPEAESAGAAEETKGAPDLVLARVDGNGSLALAEQKGKVVLVDLWATWCAPCIKELPHLQALADKFGPDDFLMLGVVLESGDAAEIQEFVTEKQIRYPQVLGVEGTKESFGPFLGYPTKYLIDRDGRVVKRYFGMVGEELASDVETLIRTGNLQATTS
ncbi:MAG TPA: TlpA disulfide reductase family protein [Vicinamibacteria bacterium]|nr:TlpA disulfide reductase family protein [Vicinamibacteria bacterium]